MCRALTLTLQPNPSAHPTPTPPTQGGPREVPDVPRPAPAPLHPPRAGSA